MEAPKFIRQLGPIRAASAIVVGLTTGYVVGNTFETAAIINQFHNETTITNTVNIGPEKQYPADVIVVFGAGTDKKDGKPIPNAIERQRLKAGFIALTELHLAPKMLLLGTNDSANAEGEIDYLKGLAYTKDEEFPADSVDVEVVSENTYENTQAEERYLKENCITKAVDVSNLDHLDRIVVDEAAVGLTAPKFSVAHLAAEDLVPQKQVKLDLFLSQSRPFWQKDPHELLGIAAVTLDRSNRIETAWNQIKKAKITWIEKEDHYQKLLQEKAPDIKWSVTNQARMHLFHHHPPYKNSEEALSKWVETATCVGATLDDNNNVILTAPHGIDDLVNLILRPVPDSYQDLSAFYDRINKKHWLQK